MRGETRAWVVLCLYPAKPALLLALELDFRWESAKLQLAVMKPVDSRLGPGAQCWYELKLCFDVDSR